MFLHRYQTQIVFPCCWQQQKGWSACCCSLLPLLTQTVGWPLQKRRCFCLHLPLQILIEGAGGPMQALQDSRMLTGYVKS